MTKEQLINKYEVYVNNAKKKLESSKIEKEISACKMMIECCLEVIDDLKKL